MGAFYIKIMRFTGFLRVQIIFGMPIFREPCSPLYQYQASRPDLYNNKCTNTFKINYYWNWFWSYFTFFFWELTRSNYYVSILSTFNQ